LKKKAIAGFNMSVINYQIEFQKLLERKYFSSKMHLVRKDAFSKFEVTGFPTQKWEDWRFTNLSALTEKHFLISEIKDAPQHILDMSLFEIEGLNTIVIYNGHFQQDISSVPNGVKILNGDEYNDRKSNQTSYSEKSPFDLLNTAFMDSGVCLIVDRNTIIQSPVRILFISNGESSIMVNPRVYIDVEAGSSFTFVEEHIGDAVSFFQNEAVYIAIEKNSEVEHIRIQSNSENTYNMNNLHVKQLEDSRYQFYQYADGGFFSRSNINVDLDGENAECSINCLSLSRRNQHIDNSIMVNHNRPHTHSSQLAKSVLFDNSSGVFNGRTIVKKDAQKIEAHQLNKNLLLSKAAKMNSIPQLEIYADDVKCSHGSTTGQLDDDALFYFQSRGIPKNEAFILLVSGFVSEVMEQIKFEPIKNYIDQKINTWIS
jgi:Fe-S cluster assembly protein SufD